MASLAGGLLCLNATLRLEAERLSIDKRKATPVSFPWKERQLKNGSGIVEMASAKGVGVIQTELGTRKTENFVERLYEKVTQDTSFTKKERECIAPENSLNVPTTPTYFNIPGTFRSKALRSFVTK